MTSPSIQIIRDQFTEDAGVKAAVLRLDQIHPIVSGNKLFKLKPYLDLAVQTRCNEVVSFGGSHSNHLVALAYACKEASLRCTGIIRGEEPAQLSPTLLDCISYGMKMKYVDRKTFRDLLQDHSPLQNEQTLIIPEGGYGELGMLGASTMMQLEGVAEYDTILASTGTGTMGAGLIYGSKSHHYIHLVSALKNNESIKQEISTLLSYEPTNATIHFGYDMGGYAKKNEELIHFMNELFQNHGIPTDIVYTGKLFYAFYQMLLKQVFKKDSSILIIHSGGLQGNRSIKNGILAF